MNTSIIKIMKDPDVVAQLRKLGAEPMLMAPNKFDQMVKTEMDAAAILVKESKMTIN
jgi:tripartite-type tricarboxylate transporter receptor subunit TctC